MKMLVAGCFRMKGVSDKGPYDFSQVIGLAPIERVKNDKMEKTGSGLDSTVIDCEESAVPLFAQYEGKFPLWLDLDTDVAPRYGKFVTVVSGIKGAIAPLKAA